ncbi:hypothetical protein K7711_33820 [Nocardia sp. CA2R105]|uniref:hypothetical protein n=1 Tax=Nocardia coffeae TaxID=2873381 RepID=UPI001CA6DAB4|nr:hypothetical protein [Nocardia coffeae]MBY8861496.1 hypothetical protein [Nocardia coffeae]
MTNVCAAGFDADRVALVRDDPDARLGLLRRLYEPPPDRGARHLPYRRAALAFMGWQVRRGLLNPLTSPAPGSPWWRAVNERLLLDTCEARARTFGEGGEPSTHSAGLSMEFARRPSARTWYRAHNASVVSAYLEHRDLAEQENRVERFFLNVVLVRVLYAHALVAAPRLALSWGAPLAPLLGDPRLGMTGIFLSLSRVLPNSYPLPGDLSRYLDAEHGFGRLLDFGVIRPRFADLYDWSGDELGIPGLRDLLCEDVPAYAWNPAEDEPWNPTPTPLAGLVRRIVPPPRR